MSLHKTLATKFGGRPVLLIVAGVGFTFSFYGLYYFNYKPYVKRKKLEEAEEYANYIFEKEKETTNV